LAQAVQVVLVTQSAHLAIIQSLQELHLMLVDAVALSLLHKLAQMVVQVVAVQEGREVLAVQPQLDKGIMVAQVTQMLLLIQHLVVVAVHQLLVQMQIQPHQATAVMEPLRQ
jgi:hypothetical protein